MEPNDPSNELINQVPAPTEPISAVAAAVSSVALMVTKALPSEEQQLALFKERHPIRYQRQRRHMLNVDHWTLNLPKNKNVPIKSFVQWEHSDLPVSEQDLLIEILQKELNRQ